MSANFASTYSAWCPLNQSKSCVRNWTEDLMCSNYSLIHYFHIWAQTQDVTDHTLALTLQTIDHTIALTQHIIKNTIAQTKLTYFECTKNYNLEVFGIFFWQ